MRPPRLLLIVFSLTAVAVILMLWFPSVPIANSRSDMQTWYDFGMFYNYPKELHWLANYRQVSRLPAVLPGFIVTRLFNDVVAAYVLFFGYYLGTLLFFYYAARRLITPQVATFATIFLATSAYVVGNFSITMPEVPGIAYNAVCLYLVAYAMTTTDRLRARFALSASGIAAGLAINCHLVLVPFVGANYAIYLVWELFFTTSSAATRTFRAIADGLLVLAGISIATAGLGAIIVVAFHGSFTQIFNDFTYVHAAESSLPPYFANWYLIGAEAGLLLTACLAALLNILSMKRGGLDREVAERLVAVSVGILTLSAVLLAYNRLGGPFLEYSSYFVCFFPYLALMIVPPRVVDELGRSRPLLYTAAVFCIGSIVAILLRDRWVLWLYQSNDQAKAALAAALCLGILYLAIIATTWKTLRNRIAWLYVLVVIALALIARPEEKIGSLYIWQQSHHDALTQRSLYVRVDKGLRFLNDLTFNGYPRFWANTASFSESGIYPHAYMQHEYQVFPKIDDDLWRSWYFCHFAPGDDVVVIDDPKNLLARAERAFSALHLRVAKVASTTVEYDGVRYELLVERVTGRVDHSLAKGAILSDPFGPPVGASTSPASPLKPPFAFTMPKRNWTYGAVFRLKDEALSGPFSVQVVARISNAPISIGILNATETAFLDRVTVGPSGAQTTVTLRIAPSVESGGLVFESAVGEKASTIEIKSMSVFRADQR